MMATTGGGGDQVQQQKRGWFDKAFSDPQQKSSGFRFNPHDEELVAHLRKRIAGVTLPCDLDRAIPTVGLYGNEGKDPRSLFGLLSIFACYPLVHKAHEFYVFVNLEPFNAGSHHARIAAVGTWNLNNKRSIVDARGRTLGKMSHLTFLVPPDQADDGSSGRRVSSKGDAGGRRSKGVSTHWVMHEYSLPDDGKEEGRIEGSSKKKHGGKAAPPTPQQQQGTSSGRLVLCRIRCTLKVKDDRGGGGGIGEVAGGGDDASEGPLLLHPRKRWAGGGPLEGAEEKQQAHPVACALVTHGAMAQRTSPHAMRCYLQEDDQDHQSPVVTGGEGGSNVGDVVLVAEPSVTQDVMAAQDIAPPHAAMPVRAQEADQDEPMGGDPATDGDGHLRVATTATGDEPALAGHNMFDGLDDLPPPERQHHIDWDCLPCIDPEHSYTDAVLPAGDDPGCSALITQQPSERPYDDAVLAAGEDPGFVDAAAFFPTS